MATGPTPQNIELHAQVNVLAPYLRTRLLAPSLTASTVVGVSTGGIFRAGPLRVDQLADPAEVRKLTTYAHSKLAAAALLHAFAGREGATTFTSADPGAVKTDVCRSVAAYDGYIVVTGEYNNSIPAVLKNAIDHVHAEWARKPVAFAAYGSVGGARAVQHLRHVAIELQMAPIRASVHLPGGDFMPVVKGQKQLADLPYLSGSVDAMLDQLAWWTAALHQARAAAVAA